MTTEDVLSEGEIDALMERVDDDANGDGTTVDGEYRRFDLSARERSALSSFTALGGLTERQAAILSGDFEKVFSIEAEIVADTPVLRNVTDTLAALDNCVAVTRAELTPLPGGAFVITSAPLLSFVVNRYFGGGSVSPPATSERDVLTPSELRIGERIAGIALEALASTWQDRLPVASGALHTRAVADAIEALPRSDLLLHLGFSVTAEDMTGRIQLFLPFADLDPHQARFAPPRKQDDAPAEGSSWAPFFRRELPRLDVEVVACLVSRSIALADLLALSCGSVVPLPAPRDVALKVEGITVAGGRYGSFEGKKAVQLELLGQQTQD